jgi:hypothetical protein
VAHLFLGGSCDIYFLVSSDLVYQEIFYSANSVIIKVSMCFRNFFIYLFFFPPIIIAHSSLSSANGQL